MKLCTKCGKTKPLSEYYKRVASADGLQKWCKVCTKEAKVLSRINNPQSLKNQRKRIRDKALAEMGVSREDLRTLYKKQQGRCTICHDRVPLVTDHDHDWGHFRGLLCNNCNTAIGLLKDNPVVVQNAANYLRRTKGANGVDKNGRPRI